MDKIICHHCKKEIKEKQKYASIETCQGIKNKNKLSEFKFHLDCWQNFVNESFNKKLKITQEKILEEINQDPSLLYETLKQKSQSRFNELIKKEESNECKEKLKEFGEDLLKRLDELNLLINKNAK